MGSLSLEEAAYRLIRRKSRDIIQPCTDEQLGCYVRGIVDLQTEIWGECGEYNKPTYLIDNKIYKENENE